MKNYLIAIVIMLSQTLLAQETTQRPLPENQPVKNIFGCGVLINNQTVEQLNKKSLEFMIEHRFGLIKNEEDLFGLFAPSNIRLGLGYGVIKNLYVGIGVTKNKHLYDLELKYTILRQTKPKGIPFTITYYGDFARSSSLKDNFLNQENKYITANRYSYFNELMIARKFNNHSSLQIATTYTHLNIVDTLMTHDNLGISMITRYKFSPQSSVIVEFDYPITIPKAKDKEPKPNLGIGYELSTGGHQFQIFICSADGIINQESRTHNLYDFTKKDFLIGFNITRQWGFKKK